MFGWSCNGYVNVNYHHPHYLDLFKEGVDVGEFQLGNDLDSTHLLGELVHARVDCAVGPVAQRLGRHRVMLIYVVLFADQ